MWASRPTPGTRCILLSSFFSQFSEILHQVKHLSEASPAQLTKISELLRSLKTFYISCNVVVAVQSHRLGQEKEFPWWVSVWNTEHAISEHSGKEIELHTFCTTSVWNGSRGPSNSYSSATGSPTSVSPLSTPCRRSRSKQICSCSSKHLSINTIKVPHRCFA